MHLFSIPAGAAFLDAIAREWLRGAAARGDDPLAVADGLILLPTRRAARALADAFLRESGGRPLLLPRITAIGAADEAPLALSGALDLPPAIAPARRLALLSRLILARDGKDGAPRTVDGAWRLAEDLCQLLDEAEHAGIDLHAALPLAADGEHATHWERTLTFLDIVTKHWPSVQAERGAMSPAARQSALLAAQAATWARTPPVHPVWAAGISVATPAVAGLLRVIAELPTGAVILPHLDHTLDDDEWEAAIEPTHPQSGLAALLAAIGARREDVSPWPGADAASPRAALLSRALLPAKSLGAWQAREPIPADGKLFRLSPADQQEEAVAIALILRDAIETTGAVAALVTPDRALAGRVSAELSRFGVVADDSAGENLADTPPAVFLRLLAEAVASDLAPVPLLSMLKHPLAAAGLTPLACRQAARELERRALRGPRPAPGSDGLRARLGDGPATDAGHLIERLVECLAPALAAHARPSAPVADRLRALIQATEFCAATDDTPGPERLWAGEDGEALATTLADLIDAADDLPACAPSHLAPLLDAMLAGQVVRTRRALRGRGAGVVEHPRVFIWGLLEARLQAADVIVLGGLAEGVWPPVTDPGPWLSRPMRTKVGLPSAETRIGQSAHDFVGAACAAPVAVLSCPRRIAGAPVVQARWLARLAACLPLGAALPEHPAVDWARALDRPDKALAALAPTPRPPVSARPRKLSVTEIETLIADPYSIYAKHVLRLRRLADIDEDDDALAFGNVVHKGLHAFFAAHGAGWPDDAGGALSRALDDALDDSGVRPALLAWWRPRLRRIADWVAATEAARRGAEGNPVLIATEIAGQMTLDGPGGPFVVTGRADRIDVLDGTTPMLRITDYKTGVVPSGADVVEGFAPQLTIEAVMALENSFPGIPPTGTKSLTHWKLGGGIEAGKERTISRDNAKPNDLDAAVQRAATLLAEIVEMYDDPDTAYVSRPFPGRSARDDYRQLARVDERAMSDDSEGDDT